MSDDYQYIDVNDEQWEGTPRELRTALDKAQKALKAANQTITGFETERASTALSGVLTGFKNPERVKSAILGDKVDPLNSEAVTKWLSENGDDYARATANPDNPVEDQQVTDPRAETQQRLNALQDFAQPGTADQLAVINSMPQDLSPTQAAQWLVQHGA